LPTPGRAGLDPLSIPCSLFSETGLDAGLDAGLDEGLDEGLEGAFEGSGDADDEEDGTIAGVWRGFRREDEAFPLDFGL
jgi:hypothetical protein